jgi:hypothetical protein
MAFSHPSDALASNGMSRSDSIADAIVRNINKADAVLASALRSCKSVIASPKSASELWP